ncbi:hypothetical protein [Ruegeria sp. Ofav3-42]|uniref:hypothetical protein n=1 Tax=Ruegeria sp. Ofav3-42 TaxID=2917759 RepID=UPI001EF6AE8F|nr:hypothetical protein [Ruegeria sp. Ofav3-42]MCG7520862.1 hypothetical protein [Ruegeria sp. Ofav3-42]
MRIQTRTAINQLVDGGHYWAKLQHCTWGVWEFTKGRMRSNNGAHYAPEEFECIGTRIYTPEETDSYDGEIARLRASLSAISVEAAYSADTLDEARESIASVARMANLALDRDPLAAAAGGAS